MSNNVFTAGTDALAQFAVTAIDLENFQVPEWGNYNNLIIERNVINGGGSINCGVGISAGTYLWYRTNGKAYGGIIRNNSISNVKQPMMFYGADNFITNNNSLSLSHSYVVPNKPQCRTTPLNVTDSTRIYASVDGTKNVIPSLNASNSPWVFTPGDANSCLPLDLNLAQ